MRLEIPLEIHCPAADGRDLPVAVAFDFTALCREAGTRLPIDFSGLELEMDHRRLAVQFSPADDFRAEDRAVGTTHWLQPAPAAGARLAATLWVPLIPAGEAVPLPYPPRSQRRFLADGNAASVPHFPRAQLLPGVLGQVDVEIDGARVATYHHRPEEPMPFVYPLVGPAGKSLTRMGHPHDPGDTHAHHRSFWIAHRSVNGENFWEGRRPGSIRHRQFERQEDGPVFARLRARNEWVDPAGKPLLRERREITWYAVGPERVIDLTLRFQGAEGPVLLDKTPFGFLGLRVAKSMGVFDGGGRIVHAEGGINEPGVFWKRARWCDYSGPIAPDAWNGLACLDHPANPRHPTPWHVRHDGWLGPSFCLEEPYTLPPGESLTLRYRLLLHQGDHRTGRVDAAWQVWARPPEVRLRGPARVAG